MAINFDSDPRAKWEINDKFGINPELISLEDTELVFGIRRINRFQRTDRIYLPKTLLNLWKLDYNHKTVYIKDTILYREPQKDTVSKQIVVTDKTTYLNLPVNLARTYPKATHVKFIGDKDKCRMEFYMLKRPDSKYRNPQE